MQGQVWWFLELKRLTYFNNRYRFIFNFSKAVNVWCARWNSVNKSQQAIRDSCCLSAVSWLMSKSFVCFGGENKSSFWQIVVEALVNFDSCYPCLSTHESYGGCHVNWRLINEHFDFQVMYSTNIVSQRRRVCYAFIKISPLWEQKYFEHTRQQQRTSI